jgi:DUF1680 family protein
VADTSVSPHARWRGLALRDVTLSGGLWADRQQVNLQTSLAHGFRMLEQAGNLQNLRLAAGATDGQYRGPVFMDSDVYKWLEAVAYAARGGLPTEVRDAADQAIQLVQAAQMEDGYLDSYYQVVAPDRKWQELPTGHELYCAGHLIQAAVAWSRELGDNRLLEVSQRLIEHVLTIFGPGKRVDVPGHPEIEMALVELYRATRNKAYLELAQFFVDERGRGVLGPNPRFGSSAYYQDRVPVRESSEIEGHAVRALYLTSGVTDIYLETGERALLEAMQRQWTDFVSCKLYLTGGAGSRHAAEAFGHPYELPTERAYCETCAAIASVMWNWRMLLATGESRFGDLIERTLYNGFLSGVSQAGNTYFYVNPLLSRGQEEVVGRGVIERQPWFLVACCPPNVMRTLASLGEYVASRAADGVQIHQYLPATICPQPDIRLRMVTDYPWSGSIAIHVEATPAEAWTLQLRIPAWSMTTRARVNGSDVPATPGYLKVRRQWQPGDSLELDLDVSPRLTQPHPRIESTAGCLAIERGPLVYCLEQADHSASVLDVSLDPETPLMDEWRADLLGGVTTVSAGGHAHDLSAWDGVTFRPYPSGAQGAPQPIRLTAIPYFAWANRGPGPMRVWIHHTPVVSAIAAG